MKEKKGFEGSNFELLLRFSGFGGEGGGVRGCSDYLSLPAPNFEGHISKRWIGSMWGGGGRNFEVSYGHF